MEEKKMENTNREILEKEIDLIQACISRMGQNSFMVEGWLITLITVILALLPERFNIRMLCVTGVLISLCFWYIDGFFLKMEKLYRWKYEWVISERGKNNLHLYDLNPYEEEMWLKNADTTQKQEPNIIRIMFTKTLTPLYLPIIAVISLFFVNTFTNWF